MKALGVLIAVLALLVFSHSQLRAEDFRRTLAVTDHADIYVSTGSGNITVTSSDADRVVIVGHVHAGWGPHGSSQDRVRLIVANPPITQRGNEVHVGEAVDPSLFKNISIDYEIQAPTQAALNLHSGSGDIAVSDLGRFLAANTGSGTIRARQVHGPAQMQSGSGDIDFDQAGLGEVHARSGSGAVRLHNINGPVEAHTGSGDLEVDGTLSGAGELTTGSGSIRLGLTENNHLTLKALTGSGTISTHLPGLSNLEVDQHHLTGSVNGGGPELVIHTGSGDIGLGSQ